MKKCFWLVLFSIFLLLSPLLSRGEEAIPEMTGETAEQLAECFIRFHTQGACVVAFANGEMTGVYCYGERWINGDPVTPDTGFQVGSISKMVSAVGLMKLLEDSPYTLESELGEILGFSIRHPEYPEVPVTLRQLLTHTASLRDSGDYNAELQGQKRSLTLVFGSHAPFSFLTGQKPGTRVSYSNFGGGLIGSLIEMLSGQSVDEWMRQTVFEPLDMKAAYHAGLLQGILPLTDMVDTEKRLVNRSLRKDDTLPGEADPLYDYGLTAGRLILSAPDLCKILILLCDGGVYENTRVLKESTVGEMLTRQDHRGSVNCDSGGGLILRIQQDTLVEGRTLYGHGGKAYGMLCAAYFDPEDRTGAVMLTNGCDADIFYNGIGLLSREVFMCVYQNWIEPGHETKNPFQVE